jgi:HAD superfamily hydrolase (TIGR01509 family)
MHGVRAPAAIVFDLDGVLLDSESVWDAARRSVVAQAGSSWRESASTAVLGMSAAEWSRYLREQFHLSLEPEDIKRRVTAQVLAAYERELPLLPGASEAVAAAAALCPLGLASSANREVIDAVLLRAGLASSFAVTVSGDEVEHGKPAPDVYLVAVRALGVPAGRAVAVEDSANGIRSAHAAGLAVVAIPNRRFPPGGDALALARAVIDSLSELIPAVMSAAEPGSS